MDHLRRLTNLKKNPQPREQMPLPKTPPGATQQSDKVVRYGPTPTRQGSTSCEGQERRVENSDSTEEKNTSNLRVRLERFEAYMTSMKKRPSQFEEQFSMLEQVGISQSTYAGRDSLNVSKNIFKNIVPYDASRVKLDTSTDECSDYINASHIDGSESSAGYIACQFPLRNTVNDWWRMVWEKNIVRIVFMEPPQVASRDKNHIIWPALQSEFREYGSIRVHWAQWKNHGSFTTRQIFIQRERYRRPVTIYEYSSTTLDKSSVVALHQFVSSEMKGDKLNPSLLVCCKLGTGKTGVFICLDRVIKSIQCRNVVEIYHTLKSMREQRMQLVRTVAEYELIHSCLLSLITSGIISNKDPV